MGFLDFFKKLNQPRPASYSVDFFSKFGVSFEKVQIQFFPNRPGIFLVNGVEEKLTAPYADDVGYSSDMKYRKFRADMYCFWVTPSDANSFFSHLQNSVVHAPSLPLVQTSYSDYLGPDRDYYEENILFNAAGVSHNFGIPAYEIISHLPIGSTVTFSLRNTDINDDSRISIISPDGKQIGWYPLSSDLSFDAAELLAQLEAGIPHTATVVETGQVSGKKYWWCKLEYSIKIPYPKDEVRVFIASSGRQYHLDAKCNNRITGDVPISYAKRHWMTPCKKCCPQDTSLTT